MPEPIEVPTFTYGTYPSLDGSEVAFTDELMAQLERNTNFAIAAKILTPPVGYDEMDENGRYKHRGTEAHAHVTGVKVRNGVVHLQLSKPSAQFASDVKEGRRLRVSGEFNPKFTYRDAKGREIELGPTIVGLAALGRHRPALKNPSLVPLADLPFSETTGPVEAFNAREELRKSGFVAQTLANGKYAFSEIDIDPKVFGEEEQEQAMPMTEAEKAEFQATITNAVSAQVKPLNDKITALETENAALKKNVAQFSESSKREADTSAFMDALLDDRKAAGAPLPKLFAEQATKMLNDPNASEEQRGELKKLIPLVPAAIVKGDSKEFAEGEGGEDPNEPPALAKLRVKHFADIAANETVIAAGVKAFGEFKKDAFKGIEKSVGAQIQKVRAYVHERDTAN